MNPSDTPRTEQAVFECISSEHSLRDIVRADFARQLERELNAQIEANRILNFGVQQATKPTQPIP